MSAAALGEFEPREPQFITAFERAKESKADRRQSAMPIIRPEYIARDGNRLDSSGTRILLDEVAGDERTLQLVEEFGGFVRLGRQTAVEAAFGGAVSDQRAQQCKMADVGG